ncbi:hypothetical protein CBR_g34020 [Chara braunii]|uniref:Fatty acid hydroxylase domain-containing protein n=1 Tax=Chara braunii TaxID=69332 RepID=A0A388LHP0_CHABU|nr:hypothetical protein CBR_g34020 [Chara braunii]|eukprot:GBG81839.1 hypothetical protein CBR_g34020 [Chara braunii]
MLLRFSAVRPPKSGQVRASPRKPLLARGTRARLGAFALFLRCGFRRTAAQVRRASPRKAAGVRSDRRSYEKARASALKLLHPHAADCARFFGCKHERLYLAALLYLGAISGNDSYTRYLGAQEGSAVGAHCAAKRTDWRTAEFESSGSGSSSSLGLSQSVGSTQDELHVLVVGGGLAFDKYVSNWRKPGDDLMMDNQEAEKVGGTRVFCDKTLRETPCGDDMTGGGGSDAVCNRNNFEVDLNKPSVFQVGHLKERYEEWLHKPILTKEGPRLFENGFCEFFSRTYWWVIPLVWLPVVAWAELRAIQDGIKPSQILPLMVGGALLWTLVEYTLHRFIFHQKTSSYWMNTVHYILHGIHHKHPMDRLRLVFPPALAAVIILFYFGLVVILLPRGISMSLWGGGLFGYILYDITHYYLHHGSPSSKLWRDLKKYHMSHHFKNTDAGFGITTSFWDHVFATYPTNLYKS